MVIVEICVGSSCFLKGSEDIVQTFKRIIEERRLEDEIVLAGSFCSGKCNRKGVTIQVDDDIFTGVTKEEAKYFFNENILTRIEDKAGDVM